MIQNNNKKNLKFHKVDICTIFQRNVKMEMYKIEFNKMSMRLKQI